VDIILRNFLSLALGRYIAIGLGAVVVPLVARSLGVENYGHFVTALAASQIFAAFLEMGLTRILIKEGAADRSRVNAHLYNILVIKGVLTVLVLAALHFYALREGWLSPLYQLIILLGLCKVADSINMTFDGVFQVFQRMEYSAFILVAGRVALVAVVIAGWTTGAGLLYFAWAYFLISLLTALATLYLSGTKFAWPRRGGITMWETMGSEGVFFAISSLLMLAGARLDVVVLKEYADTTTVGLYAVVFQVMTVFHTLPRVLQTVVQPRLFFLGRRDRPALHGFYAAYFQSSLLLAYFPVLWALAFPAAVVGIFGPDFASAAPWLRLVAGVLVLRFISLAAGNVLTALDRQWERTIWTALGVGTILALLIWLVPAHGPLGCIASLWIGEGFMAVTTLAAVIRLGYGFAGLPLLRALAAGALAALILLVLDRLVPFEFFSSLAVTAIVVAASILLTRAVTLAELRGFLRQRRVESAG
jgi:O-antigen/teichoic acid export membrane protein